MPPEIKYDMKYYSSHKQLVHWFIMTEVECKEIISGISLIKPLGSNASMDEPSIYLYKQINSYKWLLKCILVEGVDPIYQHISVNQVRQQWLQ